LHNEELHDLYSSINIIRVGGACRKHGRNAYKIFFSKPEENRPFEKPRLIWKDNIKRTSEK
jgi:hypothetical protein